MAKRVVGVTEKLLKCAKEEFLAHGYDNTSLEKIAEKAGSSKGAIYIRYAEKSALFSALVDDAANGLIELVKKMHGNFFDISDELKETKVYEYSDVGLCAVTEYLYDNFDEFKLLLTCSDGEKYNDIIHKLVEVNVIYTLKFIEEIGNDAISSGRLDVEFAHLLSQAFYTGVFEVVVHDMPKASAIKHISRLQRFFVAGWMTILYPERDLKHKIF